MFAGGMTFAIPEVMPEAYAQEKLMYVSAENSLFGNVFAGGQVVEIIVRDPARDETDESQSEPTVEVNDELVRMTQGEDGYWYAYIGSTAGIAAAHANANVSYGTLLTTSVGPETCNDGGLCRDSLVGTLAVSSTAAVYVEDAKSDNDNGRVGAPTLSKYGTDPTAVYGQNNVTTAEWPFLQTWEFKDDSDVTIVFEAPGASETVVLTFETAGTGMEDFAYMELDRNSAPQGAQVFMTIYDNQLNMDPTVEDSVAFLTNGTYGVSNNVSKTFAALTASEFGDNGKLIINYDTLTSGTPVIHSQDNADCDVNDLVSTEAENGGSDFSGYHCFTETGSNTGIFTNGDDTDTATANVNESAKRGTTATFDYNDSAQSLLVTSSSATIDMAEGDAGDVWTSGEAITVTLVDPDRNLNTNSDEDLTVATTANVPTIKIGNAKGVVAGSSDGTTGNVTASYVHATSGIVTWTSVDLAGAAATGVVAATDGYAATPTPDWTFDSGLTADGVNKMNFTINSGGGATVERYVILDMSSTCVDGTVDVAGLSSQSNKGVLSYGTADLTLAQTDLICNITSGEYTALGETNLGFFEFAAFGASDNHANYRVEVEETDDNTGIFVGDVEFIMFNQNTIDDDQSGALTATSDSISMAMTADLTGTDAPRISYNDTDGDGVYTKVSDQVDAPSHSGTVEFDQESYKIADTVTITLTDMDLNTDSELIDVYLTQSTDKVEDADTADYGKHILDVYFGDAEFNDDCESQLAGSGLFDTGFQLVETSNTSGVFTGTFQIPSEVCNSTNARDTTGLDMFTNY